MEREKLLEEYKVTLESLVEKTKYVYSEGFYALDEFDKQKFQKDKMATEAHLGTLCNLLWGNKFQLNGGGLYDLFGLSLIGSMFGSCGFGGGKTGVDYLKSEVDKDEKNANHEDNYVVPV